MCVLYYNINVENPIHSIQSALDTAAEVPTSVFRTYTCRKLHFSEIRV